MDAASAPNTFVQNGMSRSVQHIPIANPWFTPFIKDDDMSFCSVILPFGAKRDEEWAKVIKVVAISWCVSLFFFSSDARTKHPTRMTKHIDEDAVRDIVDQSVDDYDASVSVFRRYALIMSIVFTLLVIAAVIQLLIPTTLVDVNATSGGITGPFAADTSYQVKGSKVGNIVTLRFPAKYPPSTTATGDFLHFGSLIPAFRPKEIIYLFVHVADYNNGYRVGILRIEPNGAMTMGIQHQVNGINPFSSPVGGAGMPFAVQVAYSV